MQADLAETDERLAALTAARDEKYADIDAELARSRREREPVVGAAARRPARALRAAPREQERRRASPSCGPRQCSGCMLSLDPPRSPTSAPRRRGRGRAVRAVPADPGPHQRERALTCPTRAGPARSSSRPTAVRAATPGPAAYGAVLKDADTGEVIAEDGQTIGVATNNVAEYSGLIAGLKLAEKLRAGRRHRGPDGLQARRRADERPLEDQAPGHEAAGDGGQPAGAVRHDVHLGPAGAEQARRPARQRGARRQARRRQRPPSRRGSAQSRRGRRAEDRSSRRSRARPRPSRVDQAGAAAAAGRRRPR